jgi:hypothetical protein
LPDHDDVKLASGGSLQQLVKCWALVSALRTRDAAVREFSNNVPPIAIHHLAQLLKLVLNGLD